MKYRVLWSPQSEQQLEALLADAPDDAQLVVAAREVDRHLFTHPQSFGESRFDTVRLGFVRPLGVQYEVLDDVRTVIVYDVWRIDRK